MPVNDATLRTILVDGGIVPAADFDRSRQDAAARGAALDDTLVERGLVPEDRLGKYVAEAFAVPYAEFDPAEATDHVLRIVPERVARASGVVAFGTDASGRLKLAMRDPSDLETARFIEKRAGMRVAPHYATAKGIRAALARYAEDLESAVAATLAEERERPPSDEDEPAAGDDTAGTIVELLLGYAYRHGATHVHVEAREGGAAVRYRIDGVLHDVVSLPRDAGRRVIALIKSQAGLPADERFAPQEGKLQEIVDGERFDLRVSVVPLVGGEKAVLRIVSEKGRTFGIDDLGMSVRDAEKLRRASRKAFGMILAAGPSGSGRTATLYAALKTVDARKLNVATIEDPVEYALEGANQVQVDPKSGLTFAAGLRSIVRQDPDVILVGELKDDDTAALAVNAAMTGHLVLAAVLAHDAASAPARLRELQVEPFLAASTVNAVVAQRLVRRLCTRCVTSYDASLDDMAGVIPEEALAKLAATIPEPKPAPRAKGAAAPTPASSSKEGRGPDRSVGTPIAPKPPRTVRLFKGKGCEACDRTGYKGRVGLFEVFEPSDAARDLIVKGADAGAVARQAVADGMTTMLDDGLAKVLAGTTTLDEVLRAAG